MARGMTALLPEAVGSALRPLRNLVGHLPFEGGNYPYVVVRIKAKKTRLLPRDAYLKMLQMELPSIARLLGEGEYREQITALGARYSGVDLLERATSQNLAATFTQIHAFSEGGLRDLLEAYLDRWDVFNIKTILRGKKYGASAADITEDLVAAGALPEEFLRQLVEMESLEEIQDALEGTVFTAPLDELDRDLAALEDLSEYEDLLARAYYDNLLEAIPAGSEAQILLRLFVSREIDILNVKTLLRMATGAGTAERPLLLDGGLELSPKVLSGLVGLDLPALGARLSKFSFYDAIAPHLAEVPTEGIGLVERELEKHHLREGARFSYEHPISILPILHYMVAKEIEVQNIRIVARGKAAGLAPEEIRELLVV